MLLTSRFEQERANDSSKNIRQIFFLHLIFKFIQAFFPPFVKPDIVSIIFNSFHILQKAQNRTLKINSKIEKRTKLVA